MTSTVVVAHAEHNDNVEKYGLSLIEIPLATDLSLELCGTSLRLYFPDEYNVDDFDRPQSYSFTLKSNY